jgi:hypothetical protein
MSEFKKSGSYCGYLNCELTWLSFAARGSNRVKAYPTKSDQIRPAGMFKVRGSSQSGWVRLSQTVEVEKGPRPHPGLLPVGEGKAGAARGVAEAVCGGGQSDSVRLGQTSLAGKWGSPSSWPSPPGRRNGKGRVGNIGRVGWDGPSGSVKPKRKEEGKRKKDEGRSKLGRVAGPQSNHVKPSQTSAGKRERRMDWGERRLRYCGGTYYE